MRILFLSPHSDPHAKLGEPDAGGQCVYENELARELSEAGHEVLTFCRQRNKHSAVTKVNDGYTIYRITAGGEGFLPKENIAGVMPEFINQVGEILTQKPAKNEETIIHGHYWDGAMAGLMLKANYQDYPMVWTPHSLGFAKRDKFKGIGYESFHHFIPRLTWENYATTIANRVICSTRDEKRKLVKYYHCLPQRVNIVPPGVSIGSDKYAAKYLREWGLQPGTRILLCLGRMARTKGYQHAIRIAHYLRDQVKEKYALVIVGGGSKISSAEEIKYRGELKRLVIKYGLTDRVIFQPSVPHDEIQSIYSLADIYLMTAEEEPFGLTVIEAMAAGCVVISHNRGGSKNILKNNLTGFSVDMHKYSDAAKLITELLAKRFKLERIGEKARAAVNNKYSWNSRLPQYLKVYEEIKNPDKSRLEKLLRTDQFLQNNLHVAEKNDPRGTREIRPLFTNDPVHNPIFYSV